ncbi:hypothetical protein A2389_00835 [Candidatus Adlerbacteria bacterium RIFOXYB1_FULL_48_10]|nr:MAG: hypothetical protein A2389_00835 [Candidatus Adlerbacteria bacterium RIFOXYB1_FULL_48_10]OGC95621.1 MAG: hypothetical protein A2590_00890 [Candidatus Adlerbacteria bacterium RIFOXYD1_FULL_48_8]
MKYEELVKTKRPCPFDNPKQEEIVAENNTCYMTYALAGYHPDQLLVIPKRHVEHIDDMMDAEILDAQLLQKLGWHILRELGHGGVSFLLREGKSTGKSVAHMHYNLMPDTHLGDQDAHGKEEREVMNPEEIAATLARLKDSLSRLPQ